MLGNARVNCFHSVPSITPVRMFCAGESRRDVMFIAPGFLYCFNSARSDSGVAPRGDLLSNDASYKYWAPTEPLNDLEQELPCVKRSRPASHPRSFLLSDQRAPPLRPRSSAQS